MSVSIVISTWNRINELKLAINSINKQSYKDIELIIVDNCSDDGTIEYLKNLELPYNFTPIYMDDNSYSAMQTLNIGFNIAEHDYILVMDDDSILDSVDDISNLVKLMDENPNAAIIATNVQDIYGNVAIQYKDKNFNTVTMENFNKNNEFKEPFKYIDFSGACALFRKDLVEQVGYYDEHLFIYWNEAYLALQMIAMGHDVIFAPNIRPVHLASMTNRVHCRNHYYYIKNGNRIINENLGLRERLMILPLRSIFYSYHYIKNCKPSVKVIGAVIMMNAISFFNIFWGKRLKYMNNDDKVWIRSIYSRFFWKDMFNQIFRV